MPDEYNDSSHNWGGKYVENDWEVPLHSLTENYLH